MKHIALLVCRTELGCLCKIVEQTHRGEKFGDDDEGHSFNASNGVVLYSDCGPEFSDDATLCCRGSRTAEDEKIMLIDNPADMSRIIVAIREYNRHFGPAATGTAPAIAKAERVE